MSKKNKVLEKLPDIVLQEDLEKIKITKEKAISLATRANSLVNEAKIADLEYRIFVQHIYLKYKMDISDKIDDNGKIIRDNKIEEEQK